jgi:hypothetical protein
MIKIIVLCDFWDPLDASVVMTDVFQKGPDNYKNHIKFVGDNSFTHAIIINTFIPKRLLNIPVKNILGLAWEPLEFLNITPQWLEYVKHNIGTFFVGKLRPEFPQNMKIGYPFMCHERRRDLFFENNHNNITKTKLCCIIFSKKNFLPGHKYRFQLVNEILKSDLQVDIYGRGCSLISSNDSRIKGEFANMGETFSNYKYLISIENTQSDSYISEKFIDCIYQKIIPIYWGASNVEQYFGKNCCFKLSGNVSDDMQMIKEIIETEKELNLSNARDNLFRDKAYLIKFLFAYFTQV